MSVTEEEGGRLNAFAKEPKIEVVNQKASDGKGFWPLILGGLVLLGGLIVLTIRIS